MVLWLIGLSGSGKTTLGREIARQLRLREPNTVLIDGDEIREIIGFSEGENPYTIDGRKINAQRITSLCKMLDLQKIHVVCCVLSIFPEIRAKNRDLFSSYFEIFMNASLAVVSKRDVKGLYLSASQGNVKNLVGVDIPFPEPKHPDMVIDSSGDRPKIEELAEEVLRRSGLL